MTLLNPLKRILAQDDTIIFVGSGISRWSGLPSWEGLISELADYLEENAIDSSLVRQEAKAGDLLQAASYGFLKLTQPQIAGFMRKACRSGNAAPAAIHQAIMTLGPSCFITTNYDDLIEQAYRRYRPAPCEPRVVLNTQPLEQADIIHAQARQFIFKPHGDAGNAESIVLTREQYRLLMPEGPFSATLNTFKTLLQSRPVLFLGFGLRDPDFLYLRDLLANIYRGGMRDHYAIVSDPLSDQKDYWRAHYGIHLVGYATKDNGSDHSGLLTLLNQVSVPSNLPSPRAIFNMNDAWAILALARYAASCLVPSNLERFTIRVIEAKSDRASVAQRDAYDYWPVDRLMLKGPGRFLLLGEPGSGKSFAMRDAVNAVATELQDSCLCGKMTAETRIPVAIDLKLYDGDLEGLIQARFPGGLSLYHLQAEFSVTLYLDGYNEMPRSFREAGDFDRQLDALLEAHPGLGLVIGSRVIDGLERLGMPAYRLSQIPLEEVTARLEAEGVVLPAKYGEDIVRILQRPFYFRLLNRSVMSIDRVHAPNDLYEQFVGGIARNFNHKFGSGIDLITAMQRHAYAALERGKEAFAISDLEASIVAVAPHLSEDKVEHISNWLAIEEIIIPMRGRRAAFVHQSITEFLAARELKIRLEQQLDDAGRLINLRRWDNAIFLTLGMLDESHAKILLKEIVVRDVAFALNAVRYAQQGSEALVGQVLEIIANLPNSEIHVEAKFAFEKVPFAPSHEQALRRILLHPMLRGEALHGLAKALGCSVKQELVDHLFEECDFWLARGLGHALALLVEPADLPMLVGRLVRSDIASLDDDVGATHNRVVAIAEAVSTFPVEQLRKETFERLNEFDSDGRQIMVALICEIFHNCNSVEGLAVLAETARLRLPKSLFPLYMLVRFDDDLRCAFAESFDDQLFQAIVYYVDQGDRWSVELLEACAEELPVRDHLLAEAERSSGVRKFIFEYCVTRDAGSIFAALESYVRGGAMEDLALFRLIDFPNLDWSSYHDLLISSLSIHNLEIARLILGGSSPPSFDGLEAISLGDPAPWLSWLVQLDESADEHNDHDADWVAGQLAYLIARSSTPDNKSRLLSMLFEGDSVQRHVLTTMVLPKMDGLSLSDFSPAALDFLKQQVLQGYGGNDVFPHVFGQVADETFIRSELFVLAARSDESYDAVASIARQAGRRLGIRLALPPRSQKGEPVE